VRALLEKGRAASPRTKLLAASGLVLLLALLAPSGGLSAAGVARLLLALGALAAAGGWIARGRPRRAAFRIEEPLQVLSRRGLSPRCAVALVEAEGRRYLVTFGDSFAQVQPMRRRRRTGSPRARRGAPAHGVLQ
jgi:flagellar protein FliO/FliZ